MVTSTAAEPAYFESVEAPDLVAVDATGTPFQKSVLTLTDVPPFGCRGKAIAFAAQPVYWPPAPTRQASRTGTIRAAQAYRGC